MQYHNMFASLVPLLVLGACSDSPRSTERAEQFGTMAQAIATQGADFTGAPFAGGQATSLGVGPQTPWAVAPDRTLWRLTGAAGGRTWHQVTTPTPSSLRIAVSPEGTLWRVDTSGNIQRLKLNSSTWDPPTGSLGGGCAVDVGVGANNQAWVLACDIASDHTIWSWSEAARKWTQDSVGRGARI